VVEESENYCGTWMIQFFPHSVEYSSNVAATLRYSSNVAAICDFAGIYPV